MTAQTWTFAAARPMMEDVSGSSASDGGEIPGLIAIGVDAQTSALSATDLASLFGRPPTRVCSIGEPVSRGRPEGPKRQITTVSWDVEPQPGETLGDLVRRTVELAHELASSCRPLPDDASLRLLVGATSDLRAIWLQPGEMARLADAGICFELWIEHQDG